MKLRRNMYGSKWKSTSVKTKNTRKNPNDKKVLKNIDDEQPNKEKGMMTTS